MAEVETTRDGAVLTIALNRPDKLNAFDAAQHKAFSAALKEAADPEVRAVVLTGSGRGFCVGQDLTELSGGDRDVAGLLRERWNRHVLGLQGLEKPVLAAVNGAAAGAGLSLACACDLRIAADKAAFVLRSSASASSRTRAGRGSSLSCSGTRGRSSGCAPAARSTRRRRWPGARLGGRRHGRGAGEDAGAGGRAGRTPHPGDRDDEAPLPARVYLTARGSARARGAAPGRRHPDRGLRGGRGRLPREARAALQRPLGLSTRG